MKIQILLVTLMASTLAHAQSNLSANIPYPYYDVQVNRPNHITYIDDGATALQTRIDMIRRAKTSIDVEYFIFEKDVAGKIIMQELVAAGERGVLVRVLLDKSFTVLELDEFFAKEVKPSGVEIRYYNSSTLAQISTTQFRNHRKLLVVDGKEALTGGRNIGDDYFDLSAKFNFNDADVYLTGPIVKTLKASFEKFYDHKISERPSLPKKPRLDLRDKYKKGTIEAKSFLRSTAEEQEARVTIAAIAADVRRTQKSHLCPEITFATDAPGANFGQRLRNDYSDKYRYLRKTIFDKVSVVDKSVLISSPYMIDSSETNEILDLLLRKKVKINLYTNSLGSTDAVYVAANMYLGVPRWLKSGIGLYVHDGQWTGSNEHTPKAVQKAKWGTHAKVQIYQSTHTSEVMVGTYNVDNRSNYYNTEMAVFCKGNDEFTQEVRASVKAQMKKAMRVVSKKHAIDRNGVTRNVYGASKKDIFKLKLFTGPSWLINFLL